MSSESEISFMPNLTVLFHVSGANIETHGPNGRSKSQKDICKCTYLSHKLYFSK